MRSAYTLVELFLTLAVLMIVLGMMMNLANRVRRESADRLTRQVLARLTDLMAEYQKTNGQFPPVQPLLQPPLMPGPLPSEPALQLLARQNNADFVRALDLNDLVKNAQSPASTPNAPLTDQPVNNPVVNDPLVETFDALTATTGQLNDPWGSPIVFMAQQNPAIGMAPGDASFFFSAGPDRQYLTREDNLYSYEGGQ